MTAFTEVTINCDGALIGLPEVDRCPAWFQTDLEVARGSIRLTRAEAKRNGWRAVAAAAYGSRGSTGLVDLCPAHLAAAER